MHHASAAHTFLSCMAVAGFILTFVLASGLAAMAQMRAEDQS